MTDHRLILSPSRCGDRSTCWHGVCSCGAWTKGPHLMPETVQGYWHDHVHLAALEATDAHVKAILETAPAKATT